MRELIHLNFDWYFKFTTEEEDTINYEDVSGYEEVMLPHTNLELPLNYLGDGINEIISTYKRKLDIKEGYRGKLLELIFDGVAHKSSVYINSKLVSTHEGGYDEFRIDISEEVNYGEINYLTVVVDNHENPDIPPFGGMVDYLGYGGIYREVSIEISSSDRIMESYLKTGVLSDNQMIGKVMTSINKAQIQVFAYDADDNEVYYNIYEVNDNITNFVCHFPEKKNWSIDSPYLYKIVLRLIKHDATYKDLENVDCHIDEITTKFGFRTAEFREDGFFLNGERLKLRGLNRHQSYPYVGYAMPASVQMRDADILKYDLGLNIVRCSHYMQSKHFLDRCDEIGLLVFEEIPGWQYIGGDAFKENSYKNIESMIKRDYHHPSIILWGVRLNESGDDNDFYIKTNELARLLDDSRQTGGVRNFMESEMFEDVYTFNDFLHDGTKNILRDPDAVKRDVPYMITEYNGHMFPTKRSDNEPHLVEHALRHYRVINEASKIDRISGTIGWCMTDYNTHDYFGSGDNICYHGVLDMFRLRKPASYIYQSQQNEIPVLEVLSAVKSGDYPIGILEKVYVATNLDYIKLYKDDVFIADFYPEEGSRLPHPLIVVDDFIGNGLVDNESFTKKDSDKVKKIFVAATKYATNLPASYKLSLAKICKRYDLSIDDAFKIYNKYNNLPAKYEFVGYIDGVSVKTVVKDIVRDTKFILEVDSDTLTVSKTYDVTRVIVRKVDQNDNILKYSFEGLIVNVSGGIDLIGPSNISLISGEAAFWVKSNKNVENGLIEVETNDKVLRKKIKVINDDR